VAGSRPAQSAVPDPKYSAARIQPERLLHKYNGHFETFRIFSRVMSQARLSSVKLGFDNGYLSCWNDIDTVRRQTTRWRGDCAGRK
jgi:hypothetical protein